jgi:hypothetical protein
MSWVKPAPTVDIHARRHVDNDADTAIETTALLDGAQHSEAVQDDDASTWSGFKEFEGLPWWRAPSVSSHVAPRNSK